MPSGGGAAEERDAHEPANGSWVAELEEARGELAEALLRLADSSNDEEEGDSNNNSNNVVSLLELHHRVCRAYCMLRQWERLAASSKKGLARCAFSASSSTAAAEAAGGVDADVARFESAFRVYRKRAAAELSVKSAIKDIGAADSVSVPSVDCEALDARLKAGFRRDYGDPGSDFRSRLHRAAIIDGVSPDLFLEETSCFGNANMCQDAALKGDVRLMEATVALGASIDRPFREVRDPWSMIKAKVVVPPGSTALLMTCVVLAIADSRCSGPLWTRAKGALPHEPERLERITECAMQLVRLGADMSRQIKTVELPFFSLFRVPDLDGKTAFQLAAMSKRRDLVALMLEHTQLGPEGRAEVVHCRCGSRLPWKRCHSSGVGQPPHCFFHAGRVHYRVSPLARCPCGVEPKPYYKCCWKDNADPAYLNDSTGFHFRSSFSAAELASERLRYSTQDAQDPVQAGFAEAYRRSHDSVRESARRFRESPRHFQEMCARLGPKSGMASWDRLVYAGCLERLGDPFLWKDVHWDLDRAELLRRAREWNDALQRLCDDMDMVGEARERIVAVHTADPCGPCGFEGCAARECEVREFQRCSQCKRIAYCGRKCQKKDWAGHRKVCRMASVNDPEPRPK